MSKLRLGPLPKSESVRLAITLSSEIKAELDRYAEAYTAEHGGAVNVAALVPHMLSTFMARDPCASRTRAHVELRSFALVDALCYLEQHGDLG